MFAWWAIAAAYEVDAWTPRALGLSDSAVVASAGFDAVLDLAVERLGDRCPTRDDVLRRRLGRAIRRVSARRVVLRERPGLQRFGHGAYSGWLEREPLIPKVTTGRGGIFEKVGVGRSAVIHLAGTASTVRFGPVLLGTDKVDHFLATGFAYARWSRWARNPDRALRRGTRTERRTLGRWTSKAFSWADLAANWAGYRFYVGLLEPDSVLVRDDEACVVRRSAWDWTTWADTSWDEFHLPTVYTSRVQTRLRDVLLPHRQQICEAWTPPATLAPTLGRTFTIEGPFGLSGFCDVPTPTGSGSNASP